MEKKKKNDRATMTKNVRNDSHKMREQDYFMHENIIVFHQKKIFFPAERQIEIISPKSQFFLLIFWDGFGFYCFRNALVHIDIYHKRIVCECAMILFATSITSSR